MIDLYSGDARLIKLTEEALSSLATDHQSWGRAGRAFDVYLVLRSELPKPADYVLSAGELNAGLERFSASLGAMTIVLPEGGDYLAQKARQAQEEYLPLILVGSDYRKARV